MCTQLLTTPFSLCLALPGTKCKNVNLNLELWGQLLFSKAIHSPSFSKATLKTIMKINKKQHQQVILFKILSEYDSASVALPRLSWKPA